MLVLYALGGVALVAICVWVVHHALTTPIDPHAAGRHNIDRPGNRLIAFPLAVVGIVIFSLGTVVCVRLALSRQPAFIVDDSGFTDCMYGWGFIPYAQICSLRVREVPYPRRGKATSYLEIKVYDSASVCARLPSWRRVWARWSLQIHGGKISISLVGASITAMELEALLRQSLARFRAR